MFAPFVPLQLVGLGDDIKTSYAGFTAAVVAQSILDLATAFYAGAAVSAAAFAWLLPFSCFLFLILMRE